MQLQNSIFEVQVIRYRHRFLTIIGISTFLDYRALQKRKKHVVEIGLSSCWDYRVYDGQFYSIPAWSGKKEVYFEMD